MNGLTINLRPHDKIPMYEQIYSYIKNDIQGGRIAYGEKLPSTRALSRHLEVSRSTVGLAYEQLLSEGYIESEPCRGFFVAQVEGLYHLQTIKARSSDREVPGESYQYDFTPNGVDLKSFPYNVWRKLSRDILLDDRTELFKSGDARGEYGFRDAICNYLHQARGVNCSPDQVIVGAGSDYILMLLSTLLGKECKIAFEDPAYRQACRVMESLSHETVPISLDKSGICIDELNQSGADIAYVTPSHQYPTGIVMPVKRRMELLRWANEREGRYIIEDDYDSEFRYKGKPIPALQGYDAEGRVIYLGTFSRSVAPAIRLSYMVLPGPLLMHYQERSGFISSTVSKVDQMIMQRFIEGGYYERHLNKTRAMYKSRHDLMLEALRPLLGDCEISGENAGVHLLLKFRTGVSEEELIHRAKRCGIRVYGLSDYRIRQKNEERATVLLGYANLSGEQIRAAVTLLIRCWGS